MQISLKRKIIIQFIFRNFTAVSTEDIFNFKDQDGNFSITELHCIKKYSLYFADTPN